jgi:hypothetical protein
MLFRRLAATLGRLRELAGSLGRSWLHGRAGARRLYTCPPQLPCSHLGAGSTTGRCPSLGLVLTPMIAPFGTQRANFGHSDKKVGVCNYFISGYRLGWAAAEGV